VIQCRREDKQEDGWTVKDIYSTSYKITGLKPGISYKVEVTALRDGRESSSVSGKFSTS